MKKLILAVCITVAFSVPCMAQGIEANRLMGLSGTLWMLPSEEADTSFAHHVGFYDGKAYSVVTDYGCGQIPSASYVDLLFLSVFRMTTTVSYGSVLFCPLLGIGVATVVGPDHDTGETIRLTFMLKKVSDDWYPEDCTMDFPE